MLARNSLSRWEWMTPNLFSERQVSAARCFVGWVLMIQKIQADLRGATQANQANQANHLAA